MKFRSHPSSPLFCKVLVHGYGFLATVSMFDMSPTGCRPIRPEILKPGDTIRLKIAPIRSGPVIVQFAVVQWVDGSEVGARIDRIDQTDERKLDMIARASGRREARLARWLQRRLWGDEFQHIHLSYTPRACEERGGLLEAA